MTIINKDGQLEFTFEDFIGLVEEVQVEYNLLRSQLDIYSPFYASDMKRLNILLDVRENLYKLIEKGWGM